MERRVPGRFLERCPHTCLKYAVRAERAGRAVGEEPPEPVLDARLDARLELTLGARG